MSGRKTNAAQLAASLCVAVMVMSGCADKALAPAARRSPVVRVSLNTAFAAQTAGTTRYVDIRVGYDRTSGERVTIAHDSVDAAAGPRQVQVSVDLTSCLADANRSGARDACPVRVRISLRDTSATALDSLDIGPVDASPGRDPQLQAADLNLQRFAVRQWVADTALKFGITANGLSSGSTGVGLTGLVVGAGPANLYVISEAGHAISARVSGVWRTIHVNDPPASLWDIAMVNPAEGWVAAVGPSGLYRYNGTSATAIATVTDSLKAVAAVAVGASRFVVGVGARGIVWRGDGTTWVRDSLGPENLSDVCLVASNEGWIAGSGGTLWRWNGTAWIVTATTFTGAKAGLSCPASGQAFVRAGTTLIQWNGSSWSFLASPPGNVIDVVAASPTEMYAWTNDALFVRSWFRYNGSSWSQVATSRFGQTFGSAWVDPRGGFAAMGSAFSRVETYDAALNQRATNSYVPALRDVIMTSATSAFAVGWNQFLARWDGTRWTVDVPPSGVTTIRFLLSVWSDGPSNAWAVGNASTIVRWNGTQWTTVSDVSAPLVSQNDSYAGVWGIGSDVFIVGIGSTLRCTSATACAAQTVPGTGALNGVWGASLSSVFAVGSGGRIVRFDGTTWTQMSSPTGRNLLKVWGSSANDVWAIGDSVLVHYNGTAWADVPMVGDLASMRVPMNGGQGQSTIGLWGTAPNDVYLGGPNRTIARFDGTAWHLMPTPSGADRVLGISGVKGVGAFYITDGMLVRGIGPTGGVGAPGVAPVTWP